MSDDKEKWIVRKEFKFIIPGDILLLGIVLVGCAVVLAALWDWRIVVAIPLGLTIAWLGLYAFGRRISCKLTPTNDLDF